MEHSNVSYLVHLREFKIKYYLWKFQEDTKLNVKVCVLCEWSTVLSLRMPWGAQAAIKRLHRERSYLLSEFQGHCATHYGKCEINYLNFRFNNMKTVKTYDDKYLSWYSEPVISYNVSTNNPSILIHIKWKRICRHILGFVCGI